MNRMFLFGIVLFASALFSEEPNEKIRISSKDVHLTDQGIFVYVKGEWIPLQALSSDSKGLYYRLGYQDRHNGVSWRCNVCKAWNFLSDNACRECGRSRYKEDEGDWGD